MNLVERNNLILTALLHLREGHPEIALEKVALIDISTFSNSDVLIKLRSICYERIERQERGSSKLTRPTTFPNGVLLPRISVITPSFNQGVYIEETINSVVNQNYPNIEYIVVDGGSTDKTLEVLESRRDFITKIISEPDNGQSDALNKGFKLATGDIFCWLNSDDQFAPDALWAVALAFHTSNADLVAGIAEIYEDGALIDRHITSCNNGPLPLQELLDLEKGWNGGQFFYQPEVFFSKKLWQKAGAHVREDCHYSMDYELWCRFAIVEAKLHVIGRPLTWFRKHDEQKTADPSKFKAELEIVRNRLVVDSGIDLESTGRPEADWQKRSRIALVNDIGSKYGAGIAQLRIASCFEMAGHEVQLFDLATHHTGKLHESEECLIDAVAGYEPDAVIFGNLHAVSKDSATLLDRLAKKYPSFWVTHDFWLFTGRCAYTDGCDKYLSGCGESCPTPSEYPALAPNKIADAWQGKNKILTNNSNITILANSDWSEQKSAEYLSRIGSKAKLKKIRLGAPIEAFNAPCRTEARSLLNLNQSEFIIAFSASNLSDRRKGGELFIEALKEINIPNIRVLLIGNADIELNLPSIPVTSLGYIEDQRRLVNIFSAADVFVGPSREETFGQVFLEAALCGTPSIGFDVSGVRDALIHEITGVRVSTVSATGLQKAILSLYQDRRHLENLGFWSKFYARNEHSLEASYRTFFQVFKDIGLIDKWRMPHKISLNKQTLSLQKYSRMWNGIEGVSSEEGPYPSQGIGRSFRWCHGRRITLNLKKGDEFAKYLKIKYRSPFWENLKICISVNGQLSEELCFPGGDNELREVKIPYTSRLKLENTIEIVPETSCVPNENDSRELVFMLDNLEFSE